MMLSLPEAIRLGAAMKPQTTGTHYGSNGGTCAQGSALDAIGQLDCSRPGLASDVNLERFVALFRPLSMKIVKCPAPAWHMCQNSDRPSTLQHIVWHLNDTHKWTREAIADWVEMIEFNQAADSATPRLDTIDDATPAEILEIAVVPA